MIEAGRKKSAENARTGTPGAVVFVTHRADPTVLARYLRLRSTIGPHRRSYLLCDGSADTDIPDMTRALLGDDLLTFRPSELASMPYPAKAGDADFQVVPGNCDLIWLWFLRERPEHDRYWFVEYDVEFTGSWTTLFRHFTDSSSDLLSTTIRRYQLDPDWPHWSTLTVPTHVELSSSIRSFLPVARLSYEAGRALDRAYRRGWGGHQEVVAPTALHHLGLEVEDIGGDGPFVQTGNTNRFYTNTPSREGLYPGTFVYRPKRRDAGIMAHKLWHPVKPTAGRLSSWIRLGAEWARARLPGPVQEFVRSCAGGPRAVGSL